MSEHLDLVAVEEYLSPSVILLPIVQLITSTEPPVHWLIPNFIPAGSLMALAGLPGSGKSFLSYTLGLALASGTPILGWDTHPIRVLYFDNENSKPDAVQYLKWAWVGLGKPNLDSIARNFNLAHFALGSQAWEQRATEYVEAVHPDIIIIDTTTPSCHIEDENDNGEAAKVIGAIRRLQHIPTPAATILALKHAKYRVDGDTNDASSYTLRGAKAWEGQVDSIIYMRKGAGRPRKDGLSPTVLQPGKTRAFGLRETVHINPEWVENGAGIALHRG